jgi:hypothetical protein
MQFDHERLDVYQLDRGGKRASAANRFDPLEIGSKVPAARCHGDRLTAPEERHYVKFVIMLS